MSIITVGSHEQSILRTKAGLIRENEWFLVKEIAEQLFEAIKPHLPAAGLAAPQIGISKAIFIFSYDRDPKHLEVVINPTFIPLEETKTQGWEGCFSTILCEADWKIAYVNRFEKIQVSYLDLEGKRVEKILKGFAAKVFQHEYDHLQGIVNIDREDAVIKNFDSKEEMLNFLQKVKEKDSLYLHQAFNFAPAQLSQRPLIHRWLEQEHVKEWMHGVGLQNTLNGLEKFFQGTSNTTYWIGYDKETPFAFLITSPKGKDTITLDVFICDLNYLGKGLAAPMIREFLFSKFSHVKKVLIDPEVTNTRAIHVYQKIGFKIIGEFIASWHPVPHYQMELQIISDRFLFDGFFRE